MTTVILTVNSSKEATQHLFVWPSECYFFCFVYKSSFLLDWNVNTLSAMNAHSAIMTVLLNTLLVTPIHIKLNFSLDLEVALIDSYQDILQFSHTWMV